MPVLEFIESNLLTRKDRKVEFVQLRGIVSASTVSRFVHHMDRHKLSEIPLVVGFSEVDYLNSTSLGYLAEFLLLANEKKRKVAFFGFDNDALRLIEMTGLDEIFVLFQTKEQALDFIDGEDVAVSSIAPIPPSLKSSPLNGDILVALADEERSAPLISRIFDEDNSRIVFANSLPGVRMALNDLHIKVLVIDGCLDEYHDICREVKFNPDCGVTSIVCLGEFRDVKNDGYIILPDEQLAEPFDLRELSAVVRSEDRRRKLDIDIFNREIKLELRSDEYACENGGQICERLASICNLPHHINDSFFFAVREAIDNACVHGNGLLPDRVVEVLIISFANGVEITIVDEGEGFDYSKWQELAMQHDPVNHAKIRASEGLRGGLGISLMSRFCDKVEFLPPGNAVKLIKIFDINDAQSPK